MRTVDTRDMDLINEARKIRLIRAVGATDCASDLSVTRNPYALNSQEWVHWRAGGGDMYDTCCNHDA